MSLIARLVLGLIDIFDFLLLIYVVLSWMPLAESQLTVMLRSIVEPLLDPVRRLMYRFMPRTTRFDWSPVVLWILLRLVAVILRILL